MPITDDEAMSALRLLSLTEGIIPAIESAHALAGTLNLGKQLGPDAVILVNLSGRGDKDMETAGKYFDILDTAAFVAETADTAAFVAEMADTAAFVTETVDTVETEVGEAGHNR